jgi:hypothetical protein
VLAITEPRFARGRAITVIERRTRDRYARVQPWAIVCTSLGRSVQKKGALDTRAFELSGGPWPDVN